METFFKTVVDQMIIYCSQNFTSMLSEPRNNFIANKRQHIFQTPTVLCFGIT